MYKYIQFQYIILACVFFMKNFIFMYVYIMIMSAMDDIILMIRLQRKNTNLHMEIEKEYISFVYNPALHHVLP